MQDIVARLDRIKQIGKLSELSKRTGVRYQTIFNIIRRRNSAIVSTVEKLMPAVEAIEIENRSSKDEQKGGKKDEQK